MAVAVVPTSSHWPGEVNKIVRRAARAALGSKKAKVAIRLASDQEVRTLNLLYRHKDRPTNILSFPREEGSGSGDLILAFETVEREAREAGKSLADHVTHLVVHGVLHLLGWDHERSEKEAKGQEKLERKILARLGLPDPYR